jgi:hypothetical protein
VRYGEMRPRQLRQDVADHRVDIDDVVHEVIDMPLAGVVQHAVRAALAAQIEGDDMETAPAEGCDQLEVLLDELRSPLDQKHGAGQPAHRRPPGRKAQFQPVRRDGETRSGLTWDRIVWRGEQLHARHSARALRHRPHSTFRLRVPMSAA